MSQQNTVLQKLVVVIADDAGVRHERIELSAPVVDDAGAIEHVPGAQSSLLLGRGWHCDLIVQDPLVDAEHARVFLDAAGNVRVEDLGSLNGLKSVGDDAERLELLVGTSTLNFHRADTSVAPTLLPSRWDLVRSRLANPLWPLCVLLLVVCLQVYLSTASELNADSFVSSIVSRLAVLGVWALFWGVLSKLLRNSMQMAVHLSVACLGLVVAWFITEVAQFLGWQTQSLAVSEFIDVVVGAAWVFAIGVVTLGIATQLRSRTALWVAAMPGLLMIFFTYGMPLLQDEERQWGAPMVNESYPLGWQWGNGDSMASFLDTSSTLFDHSAKRAAERAAELK